MGRSRHHRSCIIVRRLRCGRVSSSASADDNVSFSGFSSTINDGGKLTFLSGSFYVGNSPIDDQTIFFSFFTPVTINGITQNIIVSGEDDVTLAADTLLIYAGAPVFFGDLKFTLDAASTSAGSVYATLPITLTADVAQTPEPASIALLGTGVLGLFSLRLRRCRNSA